MSLMQPKDTTFINPTIQGFSYNKSTYANDQNYSAAAAKRKQHKHLHDGIVLAFKVQDSRRWSSEMKYG